ncbi:MAG: AI-2E family transporter [Propionibacteriaceae bacterium]|nr:AI-2E family transporter [Propionibacteriaceae bacterium]
MGPAQWLKAALSRRRALDDVSAPPTLTVSTAPAAAHEVAAPDSEVITMPGHDFDRPDFDRVVPRGLQIAASWAWRVLLLGALVYGFGFVVERFTEVLIPLAVATLLAALLYPVANQLHRWGLPKALSSLISVLGGLLLISGALTLIGTQIAGQASDLSGNVVRGFDTLVDALRNSPLPINPSWFQLDQLRPRIQDFLVSSQSTITAYAAAISSQVGRFLAGFAITLFALFYFLYDGRAIFAFLLDFVPRAARHQVDTAAYKGWVSLSHFVRATILVALADAIGVLIAALIIGVPLAPALAALVFIGAFVPIVGALVSGFVAVVVALVALGWVQALFMLAAIIVVMQVEGHLLQPFLLGRAVKLHPLAVLLGIAVGIILGGIVGALMSIPILAFAKAFVQNLAHAPGERAVGEGPAPSPTSPDRQ